MKKIIAWCIITITTTWSSMHGIDLWCYNDSSEKLTLLANSKPVTIRPQALGLLGKLSPYESSLKQGDLVDLYIKRTLSTTSLNGVLMRIRMDIESSDTNCIVRITTQRSGLKKNFDISMDWNVPINRPR